jgi:hypothetical protein
MRGIADRCFLTKLRGHVSPHIIFLSWTGRNVPPSERAGRLKQTIFHGWRPSPNLITGTLEESGDVYRTSSNVGHLLLAVKMYMSLIFNMLRTAVSWPTASDTPEILSG